MFLSRLAHADAHALSWSITGPAACAADVQRVQDEVILACAAAGGCRVGAPGETTDRRALVACGADAWTVAARSDEGEQWTMRIDARPDDRARQAAMWIARSDASPPPAPAAESNSAAAHVAEVTHAAAEGAAVPERPVRRNLTLSGELQRFPEQRHL